MAGRTRAALTDISLTMASERTPRSSITNIEIPDSFLTPSPDEQVIKQRGRKPKQTSTDDDLVAYLRMHTNKQKSPLKSPFKSPVKKCTLPTRSSPRKRLRLDNLPDVSPVPITLSPVKKNKRVKGDAAHAQDWHLALAGLAQHQLVSLLIQLGDNHPEIQAEIVQNMPTPDLKEFEDSLKSLKSNIFKSMPFTKWGSSRDAFCFRRVDTHLTAFKKTCVEQGKKLSNSHQYRSLIEYVVMAWRYVTELPDWDSPTHNRIKLTCYKSLATLCMTALKKGNFSEDFYRDLEPKLINCKLICIEIEPCIDVVTKCLAALIV